MQAQRTWNELTITLTHIANDLMPAFVGSLKALQTVLEGINQVLPTGPDQGSFWGSVLKGAGGGAAPRAVGGLFAGQPIAGALLGGTVGALLGAKQYFWGNQLGTKEGAKQGTKRKAQRKASRMRLRASWVPWVTPARLSAAAD
jgi:hypothetical protein